MMFSGWADTICPQWWNCQSTAEMTALSYSDRFNRPRLSRSMRVVYARRAREIQDNDSCTFA